jgi:hypothetical protein
VEVVPAAPATLRVFLEVSTPAAVVAVPEVLVLQEDQADQVL